MTAVITVTTDFGTVDGFVGAIKGVISSLAPQCTVVDISHEIPAADIRSGAFCLWNCFKFFGSGTTHIAVVDPGVGSDRRPILVFLPKWRQFFVGPDNGIFSMIFEEDPGAQVYHLDEPRFFLPSVSNTFHGRDVFAPVAAHCSQRFEKHGLDRSWWEDMGSLITDPVRFPFPKPLFSEQKIEGKIIHIDRFGNCITNIEGKLVKEKIGNVDLTVSIKGKLIPKLSLSYKDGKDGGLIAIIGSSGLVEVSLYNASAAEALGVQIGEKIFVLAKTA